MIVVTSCDGDCVVYGTQDFEAARANQTLAPQFTVLEASWWRQRAWCIDFAMEALKAANHPLGALIQAGFDALQGAAPSPAQLKGYTPVRDRCCDCFVKRRGCVARPLLRRAGSS